MEIPQKEVVLRWLGLVPGPGPARLKPNFPMTAVQVSPGRVAAIRLTPPASRKEEDQRPRVAAVKEVALEEGLVTPHLTQPNLSKPESVAKVVTSVLEEVAPREFRVSMVIPDSSSRVSILKFNQMPATRTEVLDLVRFRLRKVLPFRIEESSIGFHLLSEPTSTEPEFLVALIQRPILWQYQRLVMGMERVPGLVDLDSFNVANLLSRMSGGAGDGEEDRALINVSAGSLTVLFFRNGQLNFYRSKPIALANGESSQPALPAFRRELASCSAFYQEHLSGSGLARATLRLEDGDISALLPIVGEELECPVEPLDPTGVVVLPPNSSPKDSQWQRIAPALGAALGRAW